MFIHSTAAFLAPPGNDAQMLKETLKQYTDIYFRRINRFVMLSLIGAHQCVYGHSVDRRTSTYLTTERGNLGDTENVLSQIYRKQSLPMPYNFINTMSNTASFYVSQGLNVAGRNISVSGQNLSLERGMELLRTDMDLGMVKSALLGGVDEVNFSEVHFQQKFGVPYDSVHHVEGSCWLYICSGREGAIAEVQGIGSFGSSDLAMDWLLTRSLSGPSIFAFGMAVGENERNAWKKLIKTEDEFDYIKKHGYCDSATAGGISLFVRDYRNCTLVHVNKDFQGRYALLIVNRH